MRNFLLGLVILALVGCGGGSTEPTTSNPVDMTSLRMVYATDIIPNVGTVGDTVLNVIATVQDADGDTLKSSYVFLNVNGKLDRIVNVDQTLAGFSIAKSDSLGVINFGIVLDTAAGNNVINALGVKASNDTVHFSVATSFVITGNADIAVYIWCVAPFAIACDLYHPRSYGVGTTVHTSDFIQNGHVGLVDSLGAFLTLGMKDRYLNTTTVSPAMVLDTLTLATARVLTDTTDKGLVFVKVNGVWNYLVTSSWPNGGTLHYEGIGANMQNGRWNEHNDNPPMYVTQ